MDGSPNGRYFVCMLNMRDDYILRENVKSLRPETLDQLAERWTVLINQIKQHEPRFYPGALFSEVNGLIQQTERIADPDPFEQDLLYTARKLAESGNLKLALFKLHEVISGRLQQ
jgi:hypothetical protein